MSRAEILETWMPNADGTRRLVTLDLNTIWAEVWLHWDKLVDTDVAAEIASATETILRRHAGEGQ